MRPQPSTVVMPAWPKQKRKLGAEQVAEVVRLLDMGYSQRQVAKQFHVSPRLICTAVNRVRDSDAQRKESES